MTSKCLDGNTEVEETEAHAKDSAHRRMDETFDNTLSPTDRYLKKSVVPNKENHETLGVKNEKFIV